MVGNRAAVASGCNPPALTVEEWIWKDEPQIDLLARQCLERGIEVIGHADLDGNKLSGKRGGRSLGISLDDYRAGTVHSQQQPDSGGAWHHFERQLQLLSWLAVHSAQYASHLASWPGNARKEAEALRISQCKADYWDRCGCSLDRKGTGNGASHEDIGP